MYSNGNATSNALMYEALQDQSILYQRYAWYRGVKLVEGVQLELITTFVPIVVQYCGQ